MWVQKSISSHFSMAGTCTHTVFSATWGVDCLPGSSRHSSIHQSPANVTNAASQVAVCAESLHITQFEEFLSTLPIINLCKYHFISLFLYTYKSCIFIHSHSSHTYTHKGGGGEVRKNLGLNIFNIYYITVFYF